MSDNVLQTLGFSPLRPMTRRFFVIGAAALTAGCASSRFAAQEEKPALFDDSSYASMYGPLEGEPFPVPAVDLSRIDPEFYRQVVDLPYSIPGQPGSIVIDPGARHLYLVLEDGKAIRYGVGVGREGFGWNGAATIRVKNEWPTWTPPKEMVKRDPKAAPWAKGMPGGLQNPLGARALYLFQGKTDTLYRIHGTNEPWSIGKAVSSGCIRLLNQDIIDLYGRVPIGTSVVVLPTADAAPPVATVTEPGSAG